MVIPGGLEGFQSVELRVPRTLESGRTFEFHIKLTLTQVGGSAHHEGMTRQPATAWSGGDSAPIPFPKAATSVQVLLDQYVQSMRTANLSESHITKSRHYLQEAVNVQEWTRTDQLSPANIRRHMNYLAGARERPLSPKTRNDVREYLRAFLQFCIDEGHIEGDNAALKVRRAKVIKRRARIIPTEEQVLALIRAARSDWRKKDRWLVYLTAATCGFRYSTLKGLRLEHAKPNATPPRFELTPDIMKAGDEAIVFMTPELAGFLATHLKAKQPGEKIFRSVPAVEKFDRDVKKAGLEKTDAGGATLSLHSLRHFASNRLAVLGFTDSERAAQNAHGSVEMTTRVYTDRACLRVGEKMQAVPPLMRDSLDDFRMDLTKGQRPSEDESDETAMRDPLQTLGSKLSVSDSAGTLSRQQNAAGLRQRASNRPAAVPLPARDPEGEARALIGVGGFEPLTPLGPSLPDQALNLAEEAIRMTRTALSGWKHSGSPGAAHAEPLLRVDTQAPRRPGTRPVPGRFA